MTLANSPRVEAGVGERGVKYAPIPDLDMGCAQSEPFDAVAVGDSSAVVTVKDPADSIGARSEPLNLEKIDFREPGVNFRPYFVSITIWTEDRFAVEGECERFAGIVFGQKLVDFFAKGE